MSTGRGFIHTVRHGKEDVAKVLAEIGMLNVLTIFFTVWLANGVAILVVDPRVLRTVLHKVVFPHKIMHKVWRFR